MPLSATCALWGGVDAEQQHLWGCSAFWGTAVALSVSEISAGGVIGAAIEGPELWVLLVCSLSKFIMLPCECWYCSRDVSGAFIFFCILFTLVMLSGSFLLLFSQQWKGLYLGFKEFNDLFLSSSSVVAPGVHAVRCLGLDEFWWCL